MFSHLLDPSRRWDRDRGCGGIETEGGGEGEGRKLSANDGMIYSPFLHLGRRGGWRKGGKIPRKKGGEEEKKREPGDGGGREKSKSPPPFPLILFEDGV